MSETTDYMNPYNDGYNIFNQFDRILFVPKHPLFQSELNELQSGQLTQQRWLADYSMNNGTILAGMGFQNEGYSAGDNVPADTNPNLFSTKNLISTQNYNGDTINDLIITTGDNYTDHGEIDITSDATDDGQPLYFTVSYNKPQSQYVTLSFDIAETGGTDDGKLENIGMELFNDTRITEATIDGEILKDGELTDDAGYNLTDTRNDNIDLSGGNWHEVVITMDVSKVGGDTNKFNLYFNAGFPSVSEGCNIKLDHFKIEQGTEPTTWELSDSDKSSVSGSDERNNKAFVSSGFVYLDGYVRRFNAQSIQIKGQGFEKIGLHLSREVVTGNQDNKIDSNTQGTSTYGEAGASREHYNLTLSYGDEATNTPHDAVIYYLYNGRVIGRANWNRQAAFNGLLAQRSYETNGSFLATPNGLQMYAHPNTYDPSLINLQFTPGVAYVLGYRIQKDGSDILPIPVERHTMKENENRILRVIPNTQAKNASDPNNPYFEDIPFENPHIKPQYLPSKLDNEATGGVWITDQTDRPQLFQISINGDGTVSNVTGIIIKGQAQEFDSANNQILLDDNSYVFDPNNPRYHYYPDYTEDTQTGNKSYVRNFYTANNVDAGVNSNQIKWQQSDNSPFATGGTAYICGKMNMTYYPYSSAYEIRSNISGEPADEAQEDSNAKHEHPDYYLIKHNGKYYISFNQCDQKLDITGAAQDPNATLSGIDPVVNSSDYQLNITYYTYLAREDLITLDKNGHFYDVTGEPNLEGNVTPPVNKLRSDNLTLNIGYVKVLPDSQMVQTQMATTPKVPFTNINDMRLELAKLRYDMSVIAANQSTMNYVDPVTLVDIFSDFFTSTDKAGIGDANFSILYNPAPYITPKYSAEGYLPLATQGMNDNQNTLTMPLQMNGKQRVENTKYINQDYQSTNSLPLNNFGLQERIGTIVCDPEFINDKLTTEQINNPTDIEVLDSAEATAYLNSKAANGSHFSTLYADGGKATLDSLGTTVARQTRDGQELQNKNSVITGYSRAYIAPQFIHIQGSGFIPNSTHYSVYLPRENDLHLNVMASLPNQSSANDAVTPENGNSEDYDQILPGIENARNYSAGVSSDVPGTVNADGQGNISCWFKIPKGQVRAMQQEVVLANDGGEEGTDEIDGITYQPYQYNNTDDVVIDNHDLINKNSEVASAATASLSASTSQEASYLSTDISQLSVSASNGLVSLSDVESEDNSMLIDAVGSMDISMDDITSAEQQDSADLLNLADGVTNYMSYVDANLTDLYASDASAQSEADDLYNSTASLYGDHLETEEQLGNLRAGVDSVADNEAALAGDVNNDVMTYNNDLSTMNQNISNLGVAVNNTIQSTQQNAQEINLTRQQGNEVNERMWVESAHTAREELHREFTPDTMDMGSTSSGFEAWCSNWHMNPDLVREVKNSMVAVNAPVWKTWRIGSDFNNSQTQGGLWLQGTEIVKPYENPSISTWEAISERLGSIGVLNFRTPYGILPIHYKKPAIPKKDISYMSKAIRKEKRKRDTLHNREKRNEEGRD